MALSEEQRRKLAAKAKEQGKRSASNDSSSVRRVGASSSAPSSNSQLSYKNKGKSSGGGGNKKPLLVLGAIAVVAVILIMMLLGGRNKGEESTDQRSALSPESSTVGSTLDNTTTPAPEETTLPIVDNTQNLPAEESTSQTEPVEETTAPAETESQQPETSSQEETTERYPNQSYESIVTPEIEEPEFLDPILREVLGDKYDSLGTLKDFGIEVLSFNKNENTGYVRVNKGLVDSGYDIGEYISVPLSINSSYADGTQTARVTLDELLDLIEYAENGGVMPEDEADIQNPTVEGYDNTNTPAEDETTNVVNPATVSGGEDFANSCYRVDESVQYDFDYLIRHINWSLSMKDGLTTVTKKSMTLPEDDSPQEYILITMDPGIFCPSGKINFADFKEDLLASPYFITYQRDGNTFKLVTTAEKIDQGYANSTLANAANNAR